MCEHPRMIQTARTDYCPDCGYEYYYGDAHATGNAQISKQINRGDNADNDPAYCYLCERYTCDCTDVDE